MLSDLDFEQLTADLLAAELGTPVERFAAGPDRGVDLRWEAKSGSGIGQCKHYQRSTFVKLLSSAKSEAVKVAKLSPAEYRFVTSFDLTVGQKEQIYEVFRQWMAGPQNVLGGRDVDGLLTAHQEIEQKHAKLWISTGLQLFWSQHSDLANRAAFLKGKIEKSIPRYVANDGHAKARKVLDEHNICIISGAPGIGKTTLAHMLMGEFITRGYEPIEVSSDANEAWVALDSGKRQVFFYDDFLGEISFSERLNKNEDRRISDLIERVSASDSKKLIMATREYILRDARLSYERLCDLDRRYHFVLELEDYSLRNRAEVLYNHLWHSSLSRECLHEVASQGYLGIIRHRAYNPRLIEYCTSRAFDLETPGYPDRVIEFFDNPWKIWQIAFEKHLTQPQRLLVLVLACLPRVCYFKNVQTFHLSLCRTLGISATERDFREAVEVLEGTFIEIERDRDGILLSLLNPSVREFALSRIGTDHVVLRGIISAAPYFEAISGLVEFGKSAIHRRGHQELEEGLRENRGLVASAAIRTFSGPTALRSRTLINYQEPAGIPERRLTFCLRNASWLELDASFISEAVVSLTDRWLEYDGDKEAADDVIQAIEESDLGEVGDKAHAALDEWLSETLEDASDWTAYASHFKEVHQEDLTWHSHLTRKFEDYMESQLDAGNRIELGEMAEIADDLGLEELKERIEETIAEEEAQWQADERPPGTTLFDAIRAGDAPHQLDSLFSRLLRE